MPDPTQLKVGDRVRFVSLPEEWNRPEHFVHRDSVAFMKRLIKRKFPSRVAEIDQWGYPSIRARMVQRGKLHYHSWLITESTGWRRVQSRNRSANMIVEFKARAARGANMNPDIRKYNAKQEPAHKKVCDALAKAIDLGLPNAESKIWHAHPVWFLDGNPIVGYSKQKPGIRLMFWSGASFDEPELNVVGKKFKDASVFFGAASEIDQTALRRWLKKARAIQWDYKNIVRRKGKLERLK